MEKVWHARAERQTRKMQQTFRYEQVWISRDSPKTRLVSRRRRVAETSPQPAETRVAT